MSEIHADAQVEWAGWGGVVRGATGYLDARTAAQTELGGPGGGTNPEELLAATLANCFTSEFSGRTRSRGLAIHSIRTEARTTLGSVDGGHRIIAAELEVEIATRERPQDVEAIAREAANDCPVCVALRATMPLRATIRVVSTTEEHPT